MNLEFKIGQVWRHQDKSRSGDKLVIIAVSEHRVFVSGFPDMVEPEITKLYLVQNYEIDNNY